jgi:NAD(P)-dependent dehydrogenase (short-subunit alcohol dehydrogenase family)
MGQLDGRIAIVTGASRGIGAEIARRFASVGASVVVAARTSEAGEHPLPGTINEVVADIRSGGGRAIAVRTDLTDPNDRRNLIETTQRELGPPDILVNNAAVTWFIQPTEFPEKRFKLMMDVQVWAALELTQLVAGGMRERGRGWILNISSRAAIHPSGPPYETRQGRSTIYGAVKAALERMSTGLAAELYEDNIAVNALSPTKVVPTPGVLFHKLIPEDAPDDVAEGAEVMAEAALVLCTGDPRTLTGRVTYSGDVLSEAGRTPARR